MTKGLWSGKIAKIMAVEVRDANRLAREQGDAVSRFFGMDIPKPEDWLFQAIAINEREELFPMDNLKPFYLPIRQLAEGVSFPGLKSPLDPWLYDQIRAKTVANDADWLPGNWVLLDVTRRPNYDNGRQMYPDTPRFREVLASLRGLGRIEVPDKYRHVPMDSRFAISADEIDDRSGVVAKTVADTLGLEAGQVTTPLCSTFNYIGNLAHPELGLVNTVEWFRNNFGRGGHRLYGGNFGSGGLSNVNLWPSDDRDDGLGFRLQVSSPSKA